MNVGEEYIVNDAVYLVSSIWIQPAFITEFISEFVFERCPDIVQRDRLYTKIVKVMQFVGLGDAVMIGVDPNQKFRPYRISAIYDSIPITAVFGKVEDS